MKKKLLFGWIIILFYSEKPHLSLKHICFRFIPFFISLNYRKKEYVNFYLPKKSIFYQLVLSTVKMVFIDDQAAVDNN